LRKEILKNAGAALPAVAAFQAFRRGRISVFANIASNAKIHALQLVVISLTLNTEFEACV
jgi:hypothetical protein